MVSSMFWVLPRTTSSDSILYLVWCHGAVMVSVLWHIISLGSTLLNNKSFYIPVANIHYRLHHVPVAFFLPSVMAQIFPLPQDGFLKLYSAHGNPLNISVWDTVLEIVIKLWAGDRIKRQNIRWRCDCSLKTNRESVVCRSCVLWRCDVWPVTSV